MSGTMTWVGLDVHARSTHGAAINTLTGELSRARFGAGVEPVIDWLGRLDGPVRAVYEAGPTGFGLARAAERAGIEVEVCAPGKTPQGGRLIGSRPIARTPSCWHGCCWPGSCARSRCRRTGLRPAGIWRAPARASGLIWAAPATASPSCCSSRAASIAEPTTWNERHRRWLGRQQFDQGATELAFIDALAAVDGLTARRQALDERFSRIAEDERLWPTVARLRAFRGIDTLTALMLHLELGGDWARFSSPRRLSAWLGLTPTLEQSGQSKTQGSITKTGPAIARRLLVESAWHYARPPRIGATLRNRQAGQPDHVLQIAWRAQHRLHRVHHDLRERGKPGNVATVAVARQLAGFCWAAATAP